MTNTARFNAPKPAINSDTFTTGMGYVASSFDIFDAAIPIKVRGAAPSGTKNGTNKTFNISYTPLVTPIAVYWNGQRMTDNVDYSLTGTVLTLITFAPQSTDAFFVDYER